MVRSGRGKDNILYLTAIDLYTSDSVLNTTFAENGRGTYPLGADSTSVADVAVTGEGKILLAGVTDRGSLLAQLRSDGTVDTQFGGQLSAGSNRTVPLFGTVMHCGSCRGWRYRDRERLVGVHLHESFYE